MELWVATKALRPTLYTGPYPYAVDQLRQSYVVYKKTDGDRKTIVPSPSETFYQHSDLSVPLADCKNKVFAM